MMRIIEGAGFELVSRQLTMAWSSDVFVKSSWSGNSNPIPKRLASILSGTSSGRTHTSA
jgi:hypothetical protein